MNRPDTQAAASAPHADSMTHTTFESDAYAASAGSLELVDGANADLVRLSRSVYGHPGDGADNAIASRTSATAKEMYARASAAACAYVREYPVATLVGAGIGALTIGYLAGRLSRR